MKIDLSVEDIQKILKQDSQMLATHVVVNRVLGSFREEAKLAMAELMRRRIKENENFDFENFIINETNETKISLKTPNFQQMKKEIFGNIIQQLFANKNIIEDEEEPEEIEEIEPVQFDEKTAKDLQDVMEQLEIIVS